MGTLNQEIAAKFGEAANLLQQQGANPFRVGAYRRAADALSGLTNGVDIILEREGVEGLIALPGIGRALGSAIEELVRTGRWVQLERLQGALDPEKILQTIPGIGPKLAQRIHEKPDIETLEGLETGAHDGRLEKLAGVGPRRAAMIRGSLAIMLGRPRPRIPAVYPTAPSVDLILEVDQEYRAKAASDQLRKIAPRRFNPSGEVWLPIMHVQRNDWHFTALYSNTARAHDLGRVKDWVVLYFHTDNDPERQCTVATETRGELVGKRVVRGLEAECRAFYGMRNMSVKQATRT